VNKNKFNPNAFFQIKLDIAGPTNKFSIIVADWPFEDFDVHSFQVEQ